MKEAEVVQRLQQELKKQLPKAVYQKHNDGSTTGIPDLSITYGGRDLWVEVKSLSLGETPSQFQKHFSALQLANCRRLEQQGRCVYLVAYPGLSQTMGTVLRPHQVAARLEKGAKDIYDLLCAEEFGMPLSAAIDQVIFKVEQP